MKTHSSTYRFLIAAGGTGGHLYPAVAVAQKILELKPEAEILFAGVNNRIEARVVPQLGYKFKSIWISGFSRKMNLQNLLFPVKVIVAAFQSIALAMKFKPRVAIGAGGFVAGPVIWGASAFGSKIMLLEQNSYPGVTNRMLEKKADEIHITFEDSRQYFREKSKLILSGNPVRVNLKLVDRNEAIKKFGLNPEKKTLVVLGGSGGARSINRAVAANLDAIVKMGIQVVWQTGAAYIEEFKNFKNENVFISAFIDDMSMAYSAGDLVLARSGASTIAEISMLGVPVIFVPSPNVAANHQYKNAESLKNENAAELIEDMKVNDELLPKINQLINDENKIKLLKENIKKFAKPQAAQVIAESAIKLAERLS